MQIEHVVVALNFTPFQAADAGGSVLGNWHPGYLNPPTAQQWQYDIGVGVGTGLGGDEFEYAQVASASVKPGGIWEGNAYNVIDRMMVGPPDALPVFGAANRHGPNCELYCVPVATVGGASATGPAYYFNPSVAGHVATQGVPIFVGRAWTPTSTRTDPLANVGGGEQWIEVRAKISGMTNAWGSLGDQHLLVGYQGFFVYIIGRKFLSS